MDENAAIQLIDQARAAADEIYETRKGPDGWHAIFNLCNKLGVKLGELAEAQEIMAQKRIAGVRL